MALRILPRPRLANVPCPRYEERPPHDIPGTLYGSTLQAIAEVDEIECQDEKENPPKKEGKKYNGCVAYMHSKDCIYCIKTRHLVLSTLVASPLIKAQLLCTLLTLYTTWPTSQCSNPNSLPHLIAVALPVLPNSGWDILTNPIFVNVSPRQLTFRGQHATSSSSSFFLSLMFCIHTGLYTSSSTYPSVLHLLSHRNAQPLAKDRAKRAVLAHDF